jgi:hypothetical protein
MISILIPSKEEKWLQTTVNDLLENSETEVEILVGLDGYHVDLTPHPQVKVIWEIESIGQRAMQNQLATRASHDYVMKVDAHCAFALGYDTALLNEIEEKMILAPLMFPLYPEQWNINHHNQMGKFVFDTKLQMHHTKGHGETMCLQGSCFMMSKKNYWDWEVCDESLGSWGHQGVELGIRAWYNGGTCFTTNNTYYGHLFRHSDEEFPYERNQAEIDKTHDKFIEKFKTKDISGLITRFDFPCDWSQKEVEQLI